MTRRGLFTSIAAAVGAVLAPKAEAATAAQPTITLPGAGGYRLYAGPSPAEMRCFAVVVGGERYDSQRLHSGCFTLTTNNR